MSHGIGDIVLIKQDYPDDWPEADGQVCVIISFKKRIHIPAARVLVLGEICEFDLSELQAINEN